MSPRLRSLFSSLLLAAGVIGGTAIALQWPLAGPVVLAMVVVSAAAIGRHPMVPAMILGGAVFAAGALVAVAGAAYISAMMPIFGACAAVSVLSNRMPRRCAGVNRA